MNSDTQSIINRLLLNPKITQIFIFGTLDREYASIHYKDKNRVEHDFLLDIGRINLLLNPFTLSTMGGFCYIKINLPSGSMYLHQAIMKPESGEIVHHISYCNGSFDTLDNRKDSLMICHRDVHSRFHRNERLRIKSSAISK